VIAPEFPDSHAGAAILNNNQLGVIVQANSGLPFNIRSTQDLNKDGVNNDRPNSLDRNAGRLGTVFYLDLRYSRFVPLRTGQRIELFLEAKNLFNTENIAGVNRAIVTDALGNPSSPVIIDAADYPTAGKSGYDQRLLQLGLKFTF
jgi:hypothetical protein